MLIAEDDSTISLSENVGSEIEASAITKPRPHREKRERTLILGWNNRAPKMIAQLDRYVPPASEVTVVAPKAANYRPGSTDSCTKL